MCCSLQRHLSLAAAAFKRRGNGRAVANIRPVRRIMAAKAVPSNKKHKPSAGSDGFAMYVLEFLMGVFPPVSQDSMTSDVIATAHAIIFLLIQNVNIYRLNFHAWNFHVFALSSLLLCRVMAAHWMLRMQKRHDVGSQQWWLRLVVPISLLMNIFLIIHRCFTSSGWISITFILHAVICCTPATGNSECHLGGQLNSRLRSIIYDVLHTFLLSSIYPMIFVRDPHLYYDKTRCLIFAIICFLSGAAIGVARACISAYIPFSGKGGTIGSWLTKVDFKTSGKGSSAAVVKPWSGDKRYVKGDLVMHRGRVHECATESCYLEPEAFLSVASYTLFRKPLTILNAATVLLAITVILLLWLAFTSVSWSACWVIVHLHYAILVWLLRQRPLLMPFTATHLNT